MPNCMLRDPGRLVWGNGLGAYTAHSATPVNINDLSLKLLWNPCGAWVLMDRLELFFELKLYFIERWYTPRMKLLRSAIPARTSTRSCWLDCREAGFSHEKAWESRKFYVLAMGFGLSQRFPIIFRVASESFRPAQCSEVLVNVG